MATDVSKLRTDIEEASSKVKDKVVAIRRDIHQNPERSKREERTSDLVAKHLDDLGIEVIRCTSNFGVIGLLKGARPGRTVALRADMDALKLQERTGLPFASTVEGIMHACGHDAHTAMLLGVAEVLFSLKDEIPGSVKFLFQPSEEAFPGGALGMIKDGALEDPKVDVIFGWHVAAELPTGTVALRPGGTIGGVTAVSIIIKGVGGHFSAPHLAVDPIVIAGNVIVGLQSLMTRQVDPLGSAVLTFGTISGGTRDNVIAQETVIRGNLGSMDDDLRLGLAEKIERVTRGIAEGMGGSAELNIWHGYPTTVNDEEMTAFAKGIIEENIGKDKVLTANRVLGGEDFAYFLQKVPGTILRLGVWDTGKYERPQSLHHPEFDLDEEAMPLGVRLMSQIAARYLIEHPS